MWTAEEIGWARLTSGTKEDLCILFLVSKILISWGKFYSVEFISFVPDTSHQSVHTTFLFFMQHLTLYATRSTVNNTRYLAASPNRMREEWFQLLLVDLTG